MKLTPIRVRGKRKRPARASSAATPAPPLTSQSSTTSTTSIAAASPSALTYVKKRSRSSSPPLPAKMPRITTDAASTSALSAVPPRVSRRPKNRPVPFDRRFPFEIIERIFLLSKNLNLPKSSPRLGWLLSGRRTLIEMVIIAFGPTWDLFAVNDDGFPLHKSVATFQVLLLSRMPLYIYTR